MKYFLDSKNQLFAFESDGSQDAYITDDMRPATDAEVAAIQNPPLTHDEMLGKALTEIRAQRSPMLDALSGIAGRASRRGDNTTATAADDAADGLLNITALPAFLSATDYDGMKAAILQRYKEIAMAAPDSVRAVFVEVFGG